MYVNIHSYHEGGDGKGKNFEAQGEPIIGGSMDNEGRACLKMSFEYPAAYPSNITRDVDVELSQKDVSNLLHKIAAWEGLQVGEDDALRLIHKLSSIILASKTSTSGKCG